MINFILRLFGLTLTQEEKEILKLIKAKEKHLAKFGGKMVVGKRGGLSHSFPSEQQEKAYYKEIKRRILDKQEQEV